ncbi:MAG: DUF6754 domain-containing protein [Chloroflexota bacterium]
MDLFEQLLTGLAVLFSDTPFLTFIIILVALFANVLIRLTQRQPMRRLGAFDQVMKMTGASVESNRSVHVSVGSTTIGDDTTMVAMMGSEFIYYMTREVAIGDAPPIFTVTEGATLPYAIDTLRHAYEAEGNLRGYNGLNIFSKTPISTRWYPTGRRSLAFAAALMSMQADDQLTGNALLGRYGIELSLILDAAHRNDVPTIAGSDHLDGQAVAYAMADDALIGEEILTASGYLSDGYRLQKRNFAIDLMRGLVVVAIIILVIYNVVGG